MLAEHVAQAVFTTLVIMVVGGRLLTFHTGNRVKRWRADFGACVLLLAVVVQSVQLYRTAVHGPFSFDGGQDIYRLKCLQAQKGGKFSSLDPGDWAANPCWCSAAAGYECVSVDEATGAETLVAAGDCSVATAVAEGLQCRRGVNATEDYGERLPTHVGGKAALWRRDCSRGRGTACTKAEPCTPCELARLADFGAPPCMPCQFGVRACDFVEGEGPYCRVSPGSTEVEPCAECCTDYTSDAEAACAVMGPLL